MCAMLYNCTFTIMKITEKIKFNGEQREATFTPLHNARRFMPRRDMPKSWRKIDSTNARFTGNNPITVWESNNGEYRFSVYQSGCFYQYVGKIIFNK